MANKDEPTDDEFAALDATGCKEHVEIVLAVLSAFKLVEDGILGEGTKALGTDKTMLVPHFAACGEVPVRDGNEQMQVHS